VRSFLNYHLINSINRLISMIYKQLVKYIVLYNSRRARRSSNLFLMTLVIESF
jgi:hypothetical protein